MFEKRRKWGIEISRSMLVLFRFTIFLVEMTERKATLWCRMSQHIETNTSKWKASKMEN